MRIPAANTLHTHSRDPAPCGIETVYVCASRAGGKETLSAYAGAGLSWRAFPALNQRAWPKLRKGVHSLGVAARVALSPRDPASPGCQ